MTSYLYKTKDHYLIGFGIFSDHTFKHLWGIVVTPV